MTKKTTGHQNANDAQKNITQRHQGRLKVTVSHSALMAFLEAKKSKARDKKVTELSAQNSLVGSVLVTRPELSINNGQVRNSIDSNAAGKTDAPASPLDEDADHIIHSPMFYVLNEISLDGHDVLVTVILNAPEGTMPMQDENSANPSTRTEAAAEAETKAAKTQAAAKTKTAARAAPSAERKTLYYGGNIGRAATETGTPNIHYLVATDMAYLEQSMPDHPYLNMRQTPNFMALSKAQFDGFTLYKRERDQEEPESFAFEGFFMVPKAAMLHSLILSDVFLVKHPEKNAVLFEPAAAKYMNAFRALGLNPKQINHTVEWAHQVRQVAKLH
jgi:hypothetical protein